MSDALLPYYNQELTAIRELAAEFADAHPKVAGRLRLTADTIDDPHVGRLLEGVAFLSARAHQRLDDEFPELTDALLGVLYPHYLAPVPSGAIVQFSVQPDLRVPVTVAAGTVVETEPVRGEPCRFRTSSDTVLWPIEVESVRLTGAPVAAPAGPLLRGAQSSLRIVLTTTDSSATFAELGVDRLRFFLRGPSEQTFKLHELLSMHAIGAALADGPNDAHPTFLPGSAVSVAGYGEDEALYPWSARGFPGFRLLTEYFAFPEKFLFVDIAGLNARTLVQASNRLEVFVYLDISSGDLERRLRPDAMALGCTPMVNLFARQCEPIPLSHQQTEYEVVADYRRRRDIEIWSVERVRELTDDGSYRPWRPFYRHPAGCQETDQPAGFFNVVRRTSQGRGTESFLAPFDAALSVERPASSVLSVDALCVNRDLPGELPFGGGQPALNLPEGIAAVQAVTCLTAPTPTLRAPLRERRPWRLISHLSLGHLSVVGGADAAEALREVLRLYDLRETADTRAAIAGLVHVSSRPGNARVPGARPGAFCRGLDVTLRFDPGTWDSGGGFLLASVLERFLGLQATVNAFVRTTVMLQGRPGIVARFPPRAGARALL
jgi:type VI secretion system protein ImpG